MERRLFLAIVLSILVLMAYSGLTARFSTQQSQDQFIRDPSLTQPIHKESKSKTVPIPQEVILAELPISEESIMVLQNEDISLSVNSRGTSITSCSISSYDTLLPQVNIGLLIEWQGVDFKTYDITNGISMGYDDKDKGFEIRKNYRLTGDNYIIEMEVEFISHSDTTRYVDYGLNIGSIDKDVFKKNPIDQRYIEFSISLPNKTLRNNFLRFNPKAVDDQIQWTGIRDRYFCTIVRPMEEADKIIKSSNAGITSYILQIPSFELQPGQRIKHLYLLYLGPQKQELIKNIGSNAEEIVNFGFFDSLSHIFLGIFNFLYGVTKNWGVTLIIFSIVVFVVMSPLSIKSFSSMKRMQEVQPIIEELKVKYKDSPQKMHKEVMELYREKKINPLGGCLPLFLQMPIFITLYQTLMRFIDLKGAHFLWIKDLSEPDRLFVFDKSLPVVGNEFNLLPVIMIVTMLVQQKLTGAKGQQGASAQQQKMMGLFMAVFFGIIFYHMPSGLVLYWSVNSILMLVFQMRMFGAKTK